MQLRGLPSDGVSKRLTVKIDFDAGVVEQMIERLLVVRAQMLPFQETCEILGVAEAAKRPV
jgi:hypothetical protein